MSFGIKHAKRKLADRLTLVYATLFALILVPLTVAVFFVARQYLVSDSVERLTMTLDVVSDHIVDAYTCGESVTTVELFQELNNDDRLSMFVFDKNEKLINRLLNFNVDNDSLLYRGLTPVQVNDRQGRILMAASQDLIVENEYCGRLLIIQNLESERTFLTLLGILLIFANMIGVAAALIIGRATDKRMLSPIDNMINKANGIDATKLNERLDVPEPDDELKSLALTINGLLDRVDKAYRQQERFAADVSHELRTPLAVMQGNVDLLSRWGGDDVKVRNECILTLQRQTEYMSKLVENLLFLARCDYSQNELNRSVFSINGLFSELTNEQSVVDTIHSYSVHTDDDFPMLYADRAMIKQLLRVLTDNSAKHTPRGGHIEFIAKKQGDSVCLTVRDNGAGMDEEHLAHIFERFYRVDKARAKATGGMGLGLSIAAAIADAHGGSISAKSVVGEGTSVTVTLNDRCVKNNTDTSPMLNASKQ